MASTTTKSLLVKLPVSLPVLTTTITTTTTTTTTTTRATTAPPTTLTSLLRPESTLGITNPIFSTRTGERTIPNIKEFLRYARHHTNEEMARRLLAHNPQTRCDEVRLRLILSNSLATLAKSRGTDRKVLQKAYEMERKAYGTIARRNAAARQRKQSVPAVSSSNARGRRKVSMAPIRDFDDAAPVKKARVKFAPAGDLMTFTVEEDAACILMAIHKEAMEILNGNL